MAVLNFVLSQMKTVCMILVFVICLVSSRNSEPNQYTGRLLGRTNVNNNFFIKRDSNWTPKKSSYNERINEKVLHHSRASPYHRTGYRYSHPFKMSDSKFGLITLGYFHSKPSILQGFRIIDSTPESRYPGYFTSSSSPFPYRSTLHRKPFFPSLKIPIYKRKKSEPSRNNKLNNLMQTKNNELSWNNKLNNLMKTKNNEPSWNNKLNNPMKTKNNESSRNDKLNNPMKTKKYNHTSNHSFSASIQGRKPFQEDRYLIVPEKHLYAVFDGHMGSQAADFMYKELQGFLEIELRKSPKDIDNAFKNAYAEADRAFINLGGQSGTTATTVFLDGGKIYVANTGDSRAVLCCENNLAIQMSEDHKPSVPSEFSRTRGLLPKVTRAIGDPSLKIYGMIPTPDVASKVLSKYTKFIIIATDGLWDVLTSQEAVEFVQNALADGVSEEMIAHMLAQVAYFRGSTDNITVVVKFIYIS